MVASIALALVCLPRHYVGYDSVQLSFAFFGCNRIDQADWDATRSENPSSANVPQITRTFLDLAALKPVPKWVFVAVADIGAAQRNSKIKTIFVMGHRNLIDPKSCRGDSPIEKGSGDKLLQAIRTSPKVKAYVCAHVHAWDEAPIGGPGGAWQIVAGNGGSKLEEDWKPEGGAYFGFAVFEIFKSGKVLLQKFSRPTPPLPQAYYEASPQAPAPAKREERVLFDPVK